MNTNTLILFLMGLLLTTLAIAGGNSKVAWTNQGSCREETPQGKFIKIVPDNICRAKIGTVFKWSPSGACREESPQGALVSNVDDKFCKKDATPMRQIAVNNNDRSPGKNVEEHSSRRRSGINSASQQ